MQRSLTVLYVPCHALPYFRDGFLVLEQLKNDSLAPFGDAFFSDNELHVLHPKLETNSQQQWLLSRGLAGGLSPQRAQGGTRLFHDNGGTSLEEVPHIATPLTYPDR